MGRYDTVSFLSDYGLADEFVGVVKSVLRTLAPHAGVIDITHDIPPHDVRAGSLALVRAVQYLAPGVILAVVDPGVGTDRRAVAVEVAEGDGVFVGPDNGLLAAAVSLTGGSARAVELTNTDLHLPAPGATFAGRDIFAPVAAHLCTGVPLDELGTEIDPFTLQPGMLPLPREEGGRLITEVLWVDRFGNVQLNVSVEEIDHFGDTVSVHTAGGVRTARRRRSYGDIKAGEVGIVIDSYGLASLAFDRTSASTELGIGPGAEVTLAEPT